MCTMIRAHTHTRRAHMRMVRKKNMLHRSAACWCNCDYPTHSTALSRLCCPAFARNRAVVSAPARMTARLRVPTLSFTSSPGRCSRLSWRRARLRPAARARVTTSALVFDKLHSSMHLPANIDTATLSPPLCLSNALVATHAS